MNEVNAKTTGRRWAACCGLALVLAAVAFSPLVLPMGRNTPEVFGLPFTLWIGLLVSAGFLALTIVGSRVHPDRDEKSSPESESAPRNGQE